MTAPLVSIIIPCYNAERFLAETLDSVQAQTFQNYEVIAIDDGSTDSTPDMLRNYECRFAGKLRWESTPNRGVCAARNRGTALATGTYFLYLDADDLLRSDALARRTTALQTNDADVSYSGWQIFEEDAAGQFVRGRIVDRPCTEIDPDLEVAILIEFIAPPVALCYSRRIVERIGPWNADMVPVDDGCFLLDAAYYGGTFVYLPGVDSDYRIAGGNISLSRSNPQRFWRSWVKWVESVERRWKNDGALSEKRRRGVLKAYARATSALFECDRPLFWTVYNRIRSIDLSFIPARTGKMRLASRLLGYPRAEGLALCWRQCCDLTTKIFRQTHRPTP